uniref:Uncharacterized protein n=1 Tax=Magallana gigas TaxID=29159 RepID=K1RHE5_MAGGI
MRRRNRSPATRVPALGNEGNTGKSAMPLNEAGTRVPKVPIWQIPKILMQTNVEDIRKWLEEDDIFIVDRGFRDAEALLDDLGIHVEMPSFLTRHSKQHSTEEANSTRFVTKLRWVVESVNGRLKTWNYLSRTIPNTQIPHIGDYVRIVSAICNKFRPDLSTGIEEEDVAMAAKMRFLANGVNELKDYVETSGLEKRSIRWKKIDSHDVVFPHLTEEEIRQLTLEKPQVVLEHPFSPSLDILSPHRLHLSFYEEMPKVILKLSTLHI